MKSEINNENRRKFEALYINQDVYRSHRVPNECGILTPRLLARPQSKYDWLELKSISSISDADAFEVAKMVCGKKPYSVESTANKTAIKCSDDINPHEKHLISIWDSTCNISYQFKKGEEWVYLHNHNQIQTFDFLRSKSYALPFLGLSVEEMYKAGWFILVPAEGLLP